MTTKYFADGYYQASLRVDDDVHEITYHSTYEYFGLREIVLGPDSKLEVIGAEAFINCEYLCTIRYENEQVNVPSPTTRLREIGDMAFFNCRNLKNIELSDNVRTLGNLCFWRTQVEGYRIPVQITKTETQLGICY